MTDGLKRIIPVRRTGNELFRADGQDTQFRLLDFWQWSMSDLADNALRGVLAEYIVAQALESGASDVRESWAAHDLTVGQCRIEVKSAAYVQSWGQKRLSTIRFSIRPARDFDSEAGQFSDQQQRNSDVYVFALLSETDKDALDPLNLDQWQFFVVATRELNARFGAQKSIGLAVLQKLSAGPHSFGDLAGAISRAAGMNTAATRSGVRA